jgi:hypothetical protein
MVLKILWCDAKKVMGCTVSADISASKISSSVARRELSRAPIVKGKAEGAFNKLDRCAPQGWI